MGELQREKEGTELDCRGGVGWLLGGQFVFHWVGHGAKGGAACVCVCVQGGRSCRPASCRLSPPAAVFLLVRFSKHSNSHVHIEFYPDVTNGRLLSIRRVQEEHQAPSRLTDIYIFTFSLIVWYE